MKGDVPPIALNFWRWALALSILLPLTMKALVRHRALIASEWKVIAGLGFTGVAAFNTCVYAALTQTTAINALIILSTTPMMIVFISWCLGEPVRLHQGAGILVSLLGALALICRGELEALLNYQFNEGDIWMCAAVLLWSVYSILLKKRPQELPQLALLSSSVIVGVAIMVPAYAYSLWIGQVLILDAGSVMAILYISVFPSFLAFVFWNRGVASIGPVRAGMFIHFMPLFGAVLSIWFLGEGLARYHIVGGFLVACGILLTNRRTKTPKVKP